jgi:hypothetical protein
MDIWKSQGEIGRKKIQAIQVIFFRRFKMNLWGYKKKLQNIKNLLRNARERKYSDSKITRLENAKIRCGNKIAEVKYHTLNPK